MTRCVQTFDWYCMYLLFKEYIQWGKKVFSQPPIVQVLPLKKMREASNCHHRYTSIMTDKMRKIKSETQRFLNKSVMYCHVVSCFCPFSSPCLPLLVVLGYLFFPSFPQLSLVSSNYPFTPFPTCSLFSLWLGPISLSVSAPVLVGFLFVCVIHAWTRLPSCLL